MGLLRICLALCVLYEHVGSGPAFIDGPGAVKLFFVISGFYMTMVLNSTYANDTAAFYANRFLRLWPTYVAAMILLFLAQWLLNVQSMTVRLASLFEH